MPNCCWADFEDGQDNIESAMVCGVFAEKPAQQKQGNYSGTMLGRRRSDWNSNVPALAEGIVIGAAKPARQPRPDL